jgi:hypothetical protein
MEDLVGILERMLPESIEMPMHGGDDHDMPNMPPGFDSSKMNMEMMQKLQPFMENL